MTALVFAGPTVTLEAIRACVEATILPPAGQGDVWRAVRQHRPRAVCLIDGVFRGQRSVWHREILWALSEGVHVIGAASMGALRAAELHPYGMQGVGRVFEAYRDGVWPGYPDAFEDDDEVAVDHAPAELGHRTLSTAMVDIRDTLLAAEAAGAIDAAGRFRLLASLKAAPYPERSLAALDRAAGQTLSSYAVPRKRLDALAALAILAGQASAAPFAPRFVFQRTAIWQRFVAGEAADAGAAPVLDRLRQDPAAWRSACLAAAGWVSTRPDEPADLRAALSAFRLARGLVRRADLDRWLVDNALDEAGLVRLLRSAPDHGPEQPALQAVADMLRATGQFAGLLAGGRTQPPGAGDP